MSEKKSHSVKVPRTFKLAAKIYQEVLAGGNLKSLVYSQRFYNIKALYALVVETLRHAKVLDYIIEKSKILTKEERLDPSLARILISELLWGKRQLPGNSRPVQTVISYKDKLIKAAQCHEELLSQEQENRKVTVPRYVRVNTICKSVQDVVNYFCAEGWEKMGIKFKSYYHYLEKIRHLSKEQFTQDFHIKELLVFPPKTDFHEHDLYINGSIILQDKASCLPAYLLAPEPGSTVLDMCAAPGMKTTHLAALMTNKGKIYAVERDPNRYELLKNTIKLSGATCVETLLGDSLSISNSDVPGVEYILVDPSCSGSGIVDRIELEPERSSDPSRLYKLGGFQIKLLHHALTEFPLAKKVIYSTCSLNVEENEEVVQKVVSYFPDPPEFKLVKKILPDSWKNRGNKRYVGGKYCLYSRPEEDLTNGFFIAVFERCEKEKCTSLANTGQNMKVTKPKKRKSMCDNTDNSATLLEDDVPTVSIISKKFSSISSNTSSKDITVETGDRTKSEEISDDFDMSVNLKQKKQKITRGRLDKSESHSYVFEDHSSELNTPKEVVNKKKKKKRLVEKSNEDDGDDQDFEDSHMLNKRQTLKKKRTFHHHDDDSSSVNILGNVTDINKDTVISATDDSSVNNLSHNFEQTGHLKKKIRKKDEKCKR